MGAASLCNACGVKWRQGKVLVGGNHHGVSSSVANAVANASPSSVGLGGPTSGKSGSGVGGSEDVVGGSGGNNGSRKKVKKE
jgi:hypothetical protein